MTEILLSMLVFGVQPVLLSLLATMIILGIIHLFVYLGSGMIRVLGNNMMNDKDIRRRAEVVARMNQW